MVQHEMYWRRATTLEIYFLSKGSKVPPSEEMVERMKRAHGQWLDKPRPWGMCISDSASALKAKVYSRTSDTRERPGVRVFHRAHGYQCDIDLDGSLCHSTPVLVPSRIWMCADNKINSIGLNLRILCRHMQQNCDIADGETISKIRKGH